MQIIVIDRKLNDFDWEKIQRLQEKGETKLFAASAYDDRIELLPEISESEKEKINREVLDKILAYGNKEIFDGTSVAQSLKISGANTWYYHKFRIYFSVRNLLYKIEAINKLSGSCRELILFTNQSLLVTCGLLNENISTDFKRSAKDRPSYFTFAKYAIFIIKRAFTGMFGYFIIRRKSVLFIESHQHIRQIIKGDSNRSEPGNVYLGPLIDFPKRKKDIGIIDLFLLPGMKKNAPLILPGKDMPSPKRSLKKTYTETIYLFQYLKILPIFSLFSTLKRLKKRTEYLTTYRFNDKIDQLFTGFYISYINSTRYYLFKFIAFSAFFKNSKVKVVVSIDENSPNYKTILEAAEMNNKLTAGVQHGSIHRLHPAYRYTTEDMQINVPVRRLFVWGPKWKDILTETGNYDPKAVISIGQPRADYLYGIIKNGYNERAYLLENTKADKIILFASQPQRDESLRKRAATDLMKAVSLMPDVLLVIKMHPLEGDKKYYQNLAKQTGCKNYKIENDLDLYLLLNSADVVVTCFSTVGTEAIYLKKPLIIIDHLMQDVLNYYQDGVAYQARNAKEIGNLLNGIFSGLLKSDDKKMEKYIMDTAYKIDGKVAERFWNELDNNL